MKPIGPIPPYFGTADDGQLMIGGQSAEELVSEAGGTPLFAYDNNIVGRQVALFRALIASGVSLYYSVTANPYEPLLNFIGRYVEGFRIVSSGELERLKRAGLQGIPIYFAGPGKRDEELEAGIAAGATISVESEAEAARAILAGERLGIQPRLALRVNAPFSVEEGCVTMGARPSPFGVDAERVPAIVECLVEAGVDWRGLQMFTAAQTLDARALVGAHRAMVASAGEIASAIGIPLPELSLGGGFDIPCFAGEEPIDINMVGTALGETLCNAPELLATTSFSIELGRWLVGESGVYLMRVVDRTESGGHTFLTTDGGGHHMLSATGCLSQAGRGNYPIAVASNFEGPAEEEVTVTGCLATPHDVFGEDVLLPRAEVGDLIAVFCAGAYGASASPQGWESRPPAFEILV